MRLRQTCQSKTAADAPQTGEDTSRVQHHHSSYCSARLASAGHLPKARNNTINHKLARFKCTGLWPIGTVSGEWFQELAVELGVTT